MKSLFLGTMVAATLFGLSAQAEKPTFSYVLAGSPSGTFNSFNKELIKDLSKYYNGIYEQSFINNVNYNICNIINYINIFYMELFSS